MAISGLPAQLTTEVKKTVQPKTYKLFAIAQTIMWQQVKNNTPNDYLFHPFIDSMHVAAGLQLKWRKQYSTNSTILWWPQRFFIWDSYYTKYSTYNVGFARFLLLRCMVNYLNVTCIYSHIPMKIYYKEEFFVFFLITVYHHERMCLFICTNQKIFFVKSGWNWPNGSGEEDEILKSWQIGSKT